MAEAIRIGIIGAGWPGKSHAAGYKAAGGCKLTAVADLIPARRQQLAAEFGIPNQYNDAAELLKSKDIDAVSICVPTHLHASLTLEALKLGKHVLCELPVSLNAPEARRMAAAAVRKQKVLMYAAQRRFGSAEQAARQAIEKGYAGEAYHVRAVWMRTRGVPQGTGWYTRRDQAGGGALADLGLPMLDLAWNLLGSPKPISVFSVNQQKFNALLPPETQHDVEDAGFALLRFEDGKSIELSATWAINQPPQQQGVLCRIYGTTGAIDVYTPQGAVLHRSFNQKGESKQTPLKGPKTHGYPALIRHFKESIQGKSQPTPTPDQATTLMQILDALYKSNNSTRSVNL